VILDLDGGSRQDIRTGIPFFDHMLAQLAFHGSIDLGINAEGDTQIDDHHTVEDVGIVLGQALHQALDQDEGIVRYGSATIPMDEALVQVVIDISGRSGLFYDVEFKREKIGDLATENIKEFLRAFTSHGQVTLHVRKLAGDNDHHICEAIFKALGRALHQASGKAERRGSSSTKGSRD
jgi:imidazoleglycerol-phosphate dehydratase